MRLALLLLLLSPVRGLAEPRTYVVAAAESLVTVHVGRAGLFKFAGHEHVVVASQVEGEVVADAADLPSSRVTLRFPTRGLRVREQGEPSGDAPKVQAKMESGDVLDVARFPAVTFESLRVRGRAETDGRHTLALTGTLSLHGVTRELELPVDVVVTGDRLTATGKVLLKQDRFGMTPVSVAGVVKVKNELAVDFRIVARAEGRP